MSSIGSQLSSAGSVVGRGLGFTSRAAVGSSSHTDRASQSTRSRQRPLIRLTWGLMIVGHLPAFVGTLRSLLGGTLNVEHAFGCIGLGVAMVFFVLKIRDVSFLRFRTDWRSAVALGLVVALIHFDAIRPNDGPTWVPECTTLVASASLVGGMFPVRRMFKEVFARARVGFKCPLGVIRSTGTIWFAAFRPPCWVLSLHSFNLRAPPA